MKKFFDWLLAHPYLSGFAAIATILSLIIQLTPKVPTTTPTEIVYNTCSDPSFGLRSWGNSEVIQLSTGWRSGWDQTAWCNQAIANAVRDRRIGGQQHTSEIMRKWEDARWGNTVLRTNRQYKYHCKFRLNWNPIYDSRQDPICGIQE